jgi:predicted negative regulator of RcsB-dependent stress response
MPQPKMLRRALAALLPLAVAASAAAQGEQEKFTNLKVLSKDIPPAELRATMNGFTRALGVRCIYCHVGEEGKPFRHEDFAKDDKPTKLKAREMLKMVMAINADYLGKLDKRADPPIRVECFTCHRGVTQPRPLQDVLTAAYDQGGMDSTVARYHALHDRYYGRAAYDFGEVPLTLVAAHAESTGHADDSAKLLAMNVEANPNSNFAKRQQVMSTLSATFRTQGADSGAALYHAYKASYGEKIVPEPLLNELGYNLLGSGQMDASISVFKLNATEYPSSSNAFESMGEGYVAKGDKKQAKAAFEKSLAIDPQNEGAKQQLEALKSGGKSKAKK